MKNVLYFLSVALICTSFYACSENGLEDRMQTSSTVKNRELKADAQIGANTVNAQILSCFSSTRSTDKTIYPEYYGGSYIMPDGELIIFIKGDINIGHENISRIANNAKITYKPCAYSYQELSDIVDAIGQYMNNSLIVSKNVQGAALIDGENKVEVYLKEYSEQAIEDFKCNVINHPAISFVQSEKGQIESTSLYAGGMAPIDVTSRGHGSFAFRAIENSDSKRKGMVTAGHVVAVGGLIYNSSVVIGTCSVSKQGNHADAAFVPITNSSYEPSNYLVGTADELSTETSLPGAGTYVNLRGAASGAQGGNIVSTKAAEDFNGYAYTDLTTADYVSTDGDSGGILYTYVSSTDTRYTVGVHLERANGVKYFSKADYVLSALNVSRY